MIARQVAALTAREFALRLFVGKALDAHRRVVTAHERRATKARAGGVQLRTAGGTTRVHEQIVGLGVPIANNGVEVPVTVHVAKGDGI